MNLFAIEIRIAVYKTKSKQISKDLTSEILISQTWEWKALIYFYMLASLCPVVARFGSYFLE